MAEKNGEIIGVFLGLQSSSYEYIADILAPYQTNFSLEIGDLLLIGDENERIVARVTQYAPEGELTSFMGLKWLSDVALEDNAVGSEIKSKKVRYRVQIKILGALYKDNKFVAGVRRIPHITSKVVKPDTKTTDSIINQALIEEQNGIVLGEYYLNKEIKVKFDMNHFNSKRTFIFARAGYGKSNLMKNIASEWKEDYGGLLVFDPEGEYAITDRLGRPGIMDSREAILITNRHMPAVLENVYNNFKIDLADLSPQFIIPILVPEEKHETIFFSKLMSLSQDRWAQLVNLLFGRRWEATEDEIKAIVTNVQDEERITPIKNNLIPAIMALHDPDSMLIEIVENALEAGRVVIMDISLLDAFNAQRLSALIIRHIFNRNQRNFTQGSEEDMIEATFVVEEAQTVLGETNSVSAFVDLAKEGRKYRLGGIFITQQPKSIPFEILSQADNFFTFHMLSKGDLIALQNANAHYSDDSITQILSEPIKGKAYMWTSNQPFVLPVQIVNFEEKIKANSYIEMQKKKAILKEVQNSVVGENKELSSILKKLDEVEGEKGEEKGNPVKLFKKLDDKERELLDKLGFLQKDSNSGAPFAVSFPSYRKLKSRNIKRILQST